VQRGPKFRAVIGNDQKLTCAHELKVALTGSECKDDHTEPLQP